MSKKKKRPAKDKPPIELTTDEALERRFSREVRDKLKQVAEEARTYRKRSPHR